MTDGSDPKLCKSDEPAPRLPRQSVLLTAMLERFGSNETSQHRVRDLSAGGMRIDQATGLREGSTVLVTVGMLESISATVAWVRGDWAGVRFATPVEPNQARGKAAVAPTGIASSKRQAPHVSPTAGWMQDLSSSYRK